MSNFSDSATISMTQLGYSFYVFRSEVKFEFDTNLQISKLFSEFVLICLMR